MKKLFLAAVLLIIILSGYQLKNFLSGPPVEPPLADAFLEIKSPLYDRARKYKKQGDLPAAVSALNNIRAIDPGDQRAAAQLNQIAATVRDQAKKGLESGDSTMARDTLEKLKQNAKSAKPGLSLPKALSPLDFLPKSMPGYDVKNEWLIEPTMAGATYLPLEPNLQKQVERIFITVEKFPGAGRAKKRLDQERTKNSLELIKPKFKRIRAYAGRSAGIAGFAWVHKNWFFTVQAMTAEASPSQQADILLAIFVLLVDQKFN